MAIILGDLVSVEECNRLLEALPKDDLQNVTVAQIRRQEQNFCFRILIDAPCECHVCSQQFRPQLYQKRSIFGYEKILSDNEARQIAADFVNNTRANFQYLRAKCDSNGAVIIKRWKKKSSEKRKALLLEIDPDMYPYQWSDVRFYEEFFNSPAQKALAEFGNIDHDPDATQGKARRPYRNVCLLPYLNVQSLKDDPARLLNLLYNRVKFTPEQWGPFDNYLLSKQWKIGSVKTAYNRNCIFMYGPRYGALVPWKNDLAHAWDIVGFPRAILVLEAQLKLSQFLKDIIEKLLAGIESGEDASSFSEALEMGLKKATANSNCVEFASVFINQPYSAPPIFSIQALLAISEAQVNLHGDHLWLLQTDPLFLRRYVNLVVEGSHRDHLTIHNQHVLGAMVLMEDAMDYWTWEWILQEIRKVEMLHDKYRDSIHAGSPLPLKYARSVGCLEALLFYLIERLASLTYLLLPRRPGFSSKWDIKYIQRLQSFAFTIPQRKDIKDFIELYSTDPLDFCLSSLAGTLIFHPNDEVDADREYKFHEPSELFAILDDHISNARKLGKKAEVARLDEILYRMYSDLSALHQLLLLVRFHQPRVSTIPSLEDAKNNENTKAWRYIKAGYLEQDHRVLASKGNTESPNDKIKAQQVLGTLMGEFLVTPKPTGPMATQKWLDQDETQRVASQKLWSQMRSRHRQTLERINIGNDDIEADLKILSADLAAEHIADVQKQHTQILARIAAVEAQKASRQKGPKFEPQTEWGTNLGAGAFAAQEPKAKVKTRSDQPLEQPGLDLKGLELSGGEETSHIKAYVSKRTLETLQSLFPKANLEERTKSVEWAAFVHAMAEVGFAARQTHGSEYSFEPTPVCKWFGLGRIVFHKPHPEPKYEAWKLLGIGKRMGKWFGWDADTFELMDAKLDETKA